MGKPTPMSVHCKEQLWLAMKRRGKSQSDIAETLHTTQPTVSKYMNSDEDMNMSTADDLAASMGLEWSGIDGLKLVPRNYDEPH